MALRNRTQSAQKLKRYIAVLLYTSSDSCADVSHKLTTHTHTRVHTHHTLPHKHFRAHIGTCTKLEINSEFLTGTPETVPSPLNPILYHLLSHHCPTAQQQSKKECRLLWRTRIPSLRTRGIKPTRKHNLPLGSLSPAADRFFVYDCTCIM